MSKVKAYFEMFGEGASGFLKRLLYVLLHIALVVAFLFSVHYAVFMFLVVFSIITAVVFMTSVVIGLSMLLLEDTTKRTYAYVSILITGLLGVFMGVMLYAGIENRVDYRNSTAGSRTIELHGERPNISGFSSEQQMAERRAWSAHNEEIASTLKTYAIIVIALGALMAIFPLYMYPTRVARKFEHEQTIAIAWLNYLFAGTVLGWALLLAWANSAKEKNITITNSVAPQAPPQPQPISFSVNTDELKELKNLLDMGVITQDEFDAKKKQLLGV